MALGESLEILRKNRHVTGLQDESASSFWIFLDFKTSAFPHLVSKRSSHPAALGLTFNQKLKNRKPADGAWHLSSRISSCDRNTNTANAACGYGWIKGGLYQGIDFALLSVDDIFIFFFLLLFLCFFYSTPQKRIEQDTNDLAKEKRSKGKKTKSIKWWMLLIGSHAWNSVVVKAKTPRSKKHLRNQKKMKQTPPKRKKNYRQKRRRRSTMEQCWSSWSLTLLFLFLFMFEEFIGTVNGFEALPDGQGTTCSDATSRLATSLCGIVDIWIRGTYDIAYTDNENVVHSVDGITTDESKAKIAIVATYGEIEDWDLSLVTQTTYLFYQKKRFVGDISKWNVENVVQMRGMFEMATAFNSDISTWSVGKVKHMGEMFNQASAFNRDLSAWSVVNVIYMSEMFKSATVFNSDLSTWSVENVGLINGMFHDAVAFNSAVSTWNLNAEVVTSMMFKTASSFDRKWCNSHWDGKITAADFAATKNGTMLCCPSGNKHVISSNGIDCVPCPVGSFTTTR